MVTNPVDVVAAARKDPKERQGQLCGGCCCLILGMDRDGPSIIEKVSMQLSDAVRGFAVPTTGYNSYFGQLGPGNALPCVESDRRSVLGFDLQ